MDIDISNLTAYIAKFKSAFTGPQRTEILTQVGRRVGAEAVRLAAEYPEPSRKPLPYLYTRQTKDGRTIRSKFKSQAQQGKVMMLVKEGKIPYRRTGTLGKSMTYSPPVVDQNSVTTEVGTNVPYAPLVVGDNQAAYHRNTWLTLNQRMNANANKLRDVAAATYVSQIEKRLS